MEQPGAQLERQHPTVYGPKITEGDNEVTRYVEQAQASAEALRHSIGALEQRISVVLAAPGPDAPSGSAPTEALSSPLASQVQAVVSEVNSLRRWIEDLTARARL